MKPGAAPRKQSALAGAEERTQTSSPNQQEGKAGNKVDLGFGRWGRLAGLLFGCIEHAFGRQLAPCSKI
jgi:hypothetical protein